MELLFSWCSVTVVIQCVTLQLLWCNWCFQCVAIPLIASVFLTVSRVLLFNCYGVAAGCQGVATHIQLVFARVLLLYICYAVAGVSSVLLQYKIAMVLSQFPGCCY